MNFLHGFTGCQQLCPLVNAHHNPNFVSGHFVLFNFNLRQFQPITLAPNYSQTVLIMKDFIVINIAIKERRKFRRQKFRRQKFRRKKFRRISKSRNFVVRKFVVGNFVVSIRITVFTKRYHLNYTITYLLK